MSQDVIDNWYFEGRTYDGTGSSKRYTDEAIIACNEIRQVFKLPLRQTQGFINSLFRIMNLPLKCLDYTTLSRCSGLIELDTFVSANESTNRGAYDREETRI